jgi:hypothetical protein
MNRGDQGDTLFAYVQKHKRRLQRHAGFFEWPDKTVKEHGIARQLIESLHALGDNSLSEPRPFMVNRAPDIVCSGANGELIALEISELVCEKTIRLNAQGVSVNRVWDAIELRETISACLTRKDSVTYFGGPYDQTMVCLHTDEMFLAHEWVSKELSGVEFGPFNQVSRAFLLFSYRPGYLGYPVIELPLVGRVSTENQG